MLRNVLVMAASGIVLFSKEYANAVAQPRLVGSLVTAMLEFSAKATGARVSFIQMSSVAVTVVTDDPQKVFIALFHDTTDAADCMAFVAREILTAFIAQHGAELGNVGHNLRDFQRFQSRILTVLRDSVRPVLRKLQRQRGVMKTIFVADGTVTHATVDVDQIGVLANLEALIETSNDMMSYSGSGVNSLTLQSSKTTCIQVTAVEQSSGTLLIVMYKKGQYAAKNLAAIHECVLMLRNVRNLQQSAR